MREAMNEPSRQSRRRLAIWIAVGAVAIISLFGVKALASSPGDAIVFCANPAGQARIVDDPSLCRSNETVHSTASADSAASIDARVAALETQAASDAARLSAIETEVGALAATVAGIDGVVAGLATDVAALQAEVGRLVDVIVRQTAAVEARLQAQIDAIDQKYDDGLGDLRDDLDTLIGLLAADFLALEARVDAFGSTTIAISDRIRVYDELLDGVTRSGPLMRFEGMNLQVVNGTGGTHTANATGNLILGYNTWSPGLDRGGSHNLVIGDGHAYDAGATGGIVAGHANAISAQGASVLGGLANFSGAEGSVVLTGEGNSITGFGTSAIVAGAGNEATNGGVVVSGVSNVASGGLVLGGGSNRSGGGIVVGGDANEAPAGIVVSGFRNVAADPRSVILGGSNSAVAPGSSGLEDQVVLLYGSAAVIPGGARGAYVSGSIMAL